MEPPSKKIRLGQAPYDNDDNDDEANLDELSMTPNQFDARQDPLYELDRGRAKAATRLKSAFERIFEKYERDFTDVGDEIDLETGEIIVNNGHLQSLEDEKDRTREGSISSNEEERIMRGKETSSASNSHPKSVVQANPSMHNASHGFHPGFNQPNMATGFYHQPPPFGMGTDPFGYPNPFMFGPPMFGNAPVDPLWQTPEVSTNPYQNRFNFMGQPMEQSMGFPHSFGHGPMFTGPSYGSSFNGFSHRPLSKKLPCAKPSGQKLLLRAASADDDSEEDDILLGGSTQKVIKIASTEDSQPPAPATIAEISKQVNREDIEQTATPVLEQDSQKSRRGPGRPKKTATQDKPPESDGRAPGNGDENTETSKSPEPTPTVEPIAASPLPSPPVEGESILARQIAAKLAQIKAKNRKAQMKRCHLRPEIIDMPNATEEMVNEGSSILPIETTESSRDPIDPLHEKVGQSDSCLGVAEDINVDAHVDTDTNPDQENHKELPLNEGDEDRSARARSDSTDFQSALTEQLESLFSDGETNTKETEESSEDNETILPSEPGRSDGLVDEEEPHHKPEDLSLDTHSHQRDNEDVDSHINHIEEPSNTIEVEYDTVDNENLSATKDIEKSHIVLDDTQEAAQDSNESVESEETLPPLPDPIHEERQSPELGSIEPIPPVDNTANEPTPEDQALDLPGEEEIMPPQVQKEASPLRLKKRPSAKTSELPIRPPPALHDSSSKTKDLPPPTTKHNANIKTPRTPKKRKEPSAASEHRSSPSRTPSTKRKSTLTSLVPDDPDDDDDELSVLSSSAAPSPFRFWPAPVRTTATSSALTSTPRKPNRRHNALVTPHRISKRTAPPATDSRAAIRGKRRGFTSNSGGVQSSPLARTVMNMNASAAIAEGDDDILTSTPSRRKRDRDAMALDSSPVRTPSGTAEKCGEDGYVCDRDFCFTCCK
ncbi:uncharacterized protein F4822DRAFT_392337 [Hypoxylon trugodes]|uniref:uncharacterized protein n=1 Tax=Hypoxylon trugodes TaxID=326681 RepID=UPI00218FD447|nr:uncharacterized protein F4822DRAFT_392337 [Hypoxylon trugodes]KAI1392827.1 hypothetical protein F4822DRAFT_392337 [Hypoxylon trugodes]